MIFRGSRPVLLRNPIFCDFSGGGGGWAGPPAPLWIGTHYLCYSYILHLSASQPLLVRSPSDLQGIQTGIAKKPHIFLIFRGRGPDPLAPHWIHTHYLCYSYILHLSASQLLLVRNPSDLLAFQDILVFLLVPPHYLYSGDNIVQW